MPPQGAKRKRTTRRQNLVLDSNLKTDALIHIIQREPAAPALAKLLNVSVSTVSRLIAELRREKRDIVSVRTRTGWRYRLQLPDPEEILRHPSSTFVIPKSACHPPRGKAEDAMYDAD